MTGCVARFPLSGLYVITDCTLAADTLLEKTERILKKGVAVLQYRNKHKQSADYLSIAKALKARCDYYQCVLIINDDLDLAKSIDADGVHIGKDTPDIQWVRSKLGQDKIIGVSCYNQLERVAYATKNGANYIALGACYRSFSKPHAAILKHETLRYARCVTTLPIVAIGGITPKNGAAIIDAGADILAVISSLYQSHQLEQTINQFNDVFVKQPKSARHDCTNNR